MLSYYRHHHTSRLLYAAAIYRHARAMRRGADAPDDTSLRLRFSSLRRRHARSRHDAADTDARRHRDWASPSAVSIIAGIFSNALFLMMLTKRHGHTPKDGG